MADELQTDSASLQEVLGQADHITAVPESTSQPEHSFDSPSIPSEGSTAGTGEVLIDWDGPDDPANPKK